MVTWTTPPHELHCGDGGVHDGDGLFRSGRGLSLQFPLNYNDIDYGLSPSLGLSQRLQPVRAELFHFETSSRATGAS